MSERSHPRKPASFRLDDPRVTLEMGDVLALIDHAASVLPFESLMLLVPDGLEASWKTGLIGFSESYEKHPMALVKHLSQKQKREDLSSLFVWGLDSI